MESVTVGVAVADEVDVRVGVGPVTVGVCVNVTVGVAVVDTLGVADTVGVAVTDTLGV